MDYCNSRLQSSLESTLFPPPHTHPQPQEAARGTQRGLQSATLIIHGTDKALQNKKRRRRRGGEKERQGGWGGKGNAAFPRASPASLQPSEHVILGKCVQLRRPQPPPRADGRTVELNKITDTQLILTYKNGDFIWFHLMLPSWGRCEKKRT